MIIPIVFLIVSVYLQSGQTQNSDGSYYQPLQTALPSPSSEEEYSMYYYPYYNSYYYYYYQHYEEDYYQPQKYYNGDYYGHDKELQDSGGCLKTPDGSVMCAAIVGNDQRYAARYPQIAYNVTQYLYPPPNIAGQAPSTPTFQVALQIQPSASTTYQASSTPDFGVEQYGVQVVPPNNRQMQNGQGFYESPPPAIPMNSLMVAQNGSQRSISFVINNSPFVSTSPYYESPPPAVPMDSLTVAQNGSQGIVPVVINNSPSVSMSPYYATLGDAGAEIVDAENNSSSVNFPQVLDDGNTTSTLSITETPLEDNQQILSISLMQEMPANDTNSSMLFSSLVPQSLDSPKDKVGWLFPSNQPTPLVGSQECSNHYLLWPDGYTGKEFTHCFPFSAIGRVVTTFGDIPESTCTGAVIGPNIVLTAAHCFVPSFLPQPYKNIVFTPGLFNAFKPFGSYQNGVVHISPTYNKVNSTIDDYAVVVFPSNLGDKTGWFGIEYQNCSANQARSNYDLTTAGYPIDKGENFEEMWISQCGLTDVDPCRSGGESGQFLHECDTMDGNSGAPIFREGVLVGIHTGSDQIQELNFGVYVSEQMIEFIANYLT